MARAGGRGSAYAVAVLLLGLACLFDADAAVHTVGGAGGWELGVDFTSWAKGETFAVGDVLFFPYTQTEHNVVVVSKAGYDACSGGNAISTYSAGNDNVTLTSAGTHYYLCSVVGHCSGGMKLAVTVAAAAAPAPPPAAATKTPPSPAPSSIKAPVAPPPAAVPSAEPPTPPAAVPSAEAPTPSSTSAPAPAPAPGTAPASAPTPGAAPATAPASTPSVGSPPTTSQTPTATVASPPPPPNAATSLLTSAGALALALSVASVVAI